MKTIERIKRGIIWHRFFILFGIGALIVTIEVGLNGLQFILAVALFIVFCGYLNTFIKIK